MPHVSHEALRSIAIRPHKTPLQQGAASGEFDVPYRSTLDRFPDYRSFPFGWMFAAFSGEVEPETVTAVRRMDRDLVVWRGADGVVTVSAAHCPHRGAHLAVGGEVDGCELVCPYHWWRFDSTGRNTRVPYRDDRPSDATLATYRTVERGGFIMFWYHPDPGVGPLWELPAMPEEHAPDWGPLVDHTVSFHAPWIEVAENYPDKVHIRTVHGVDNFTNIHDLEFTPWTHRQQASFDHDTDHGVQTEHMLTEAFGPGFSVIRSIGILEWTLVLAIVAIDWETTIAAMGYRLRRTDETQPAAQWESIEQAMIGFSRTQWDEDAAVISHKVQTPIRGDESEDEPARRYRAWAQQFHIDS